MNSLRFHNQQLKFLAAILHVDARKLQYAIFNAEHLYREWEEPKIDKRTGLPKLKEGKPAMRKLREALQPLKHIQSRINQYILSQLEFADCVHGSVKKRSNITNAKKHQGKKYKFTTDLCNFYDTLRAENVYFAFKRIGYSRLIAEWLTALTTKNNSVPQGASTSSYLQNLLFKGTDNFLLEYCSKYNITYTRFIDDLTFSSPVCFKSHIPHIVKLICQSKCLINNRKTYYDGEIFITGIRAYNNYIDADGYIKQRAIAESHTCQDINPYTNYINNIRATNKNLINKLYKA